MDNSNSSPFQGQTTTFKRMSFTFLCSKPASFLGGKLLPLILLAEYSNLLHNHNHMNSIHTYVCIFVYMYIHVYAIFFVDESSIQIYVYIHIFIYIYICSILYIDASSFAHPDVCNSNLTPKHAGVLVVATWRLGWVICTTNQQQTFTLW